jgi:hypothetical protein
VVHIFEVLFTINIELPRAVLPFACKAIKPIFFEVLVLCQGLLDGMNEQHKRPKVARDELQLPLAAVQHNPELVASLAQTILHRKLSTKRNHLQDSRLLRFEALRIEDAFARHCEQSSLPVSKQSRTALAIPYFIAISYRS